MNLSIQKRREARYMTIEDVAIKVGVSQTELKRLERNWENPSLALVRDLAILFDCNVHDLTGNEPAYEEWADCPHAVVKVEDEPFGGVYLQICGRELAYAISMEQQGRIAKQLQGLGIFGDGGANSWLNTETMCGRLLHINPRALRALTPKHDDEQVTPFHAHPEVYHAMMVDEDEEEGRGPILREAVAEAIEAAQDRDEIEDQRRIKVLFNDGTEEHRYLHDERVATALLGLDAHSFDISRHAFLHIEHERGYVNGWINLSHVAMLDVPLESYLRLTAPE